MRSAEGFSSPPTESHSSPISTFDGTLIYDMSFGTRWPESALATGLAAGSAVKRTCQPYTKHTGFATMGRVWRWAIRLSTLPAYKVNSIERARVRNHVFGRGCLLWRLIEHE